ncbi:radical SAM protein, partial [bacterium]|nr:radical SAM protein [candidate division CSSED10-310 bacterium]
MTRDDHILLDRLVGWAAGEVQPPFRMEINPTEVCNLDCVFCKRRVLGTAPRVEVPDERLLDIVAQAARAGVRQWRIVGGGEPMARPVTVEVMTAIKAFEMTGYMITNGTLFSDDTVERLVAAGWDNITISLDGPEAEVHDTLRGVSGAFGRVLRVLESFNRAKDRHNSVKPYISLHLVLCSANYNRLDDMLKLAAGHRIGYLFVQPLNIYHDEGA